MRFKIIGLKNCSELDMSASNTKDVKYFLKDNYSIDPDDVQVFLKGKRLEECIPFNETDKLLVKIVHLTEERVKCKTDDCSFFANTQLQYCSVCLKKLKKEPTQSTTKRDDVTKNDVTKNDVLKTLTSSTSCLKCNQRVGLLGFICNCGGVYCGLHRLAEDHLCTFDYKSKQLSILEKSLQKVDNGKITHF